MLASAVTFWRWLTGQPISLDSLYETETPLEERRVCLRYAANLNIRCEQLSGETDTGVLAVICDISRGGIQMTAPRRFEPGTLLSVELPGGREDKRLAVLACVIRAHPYGDSEWSMGCRFSTELDDGQLQAFGAARVRPPTSDPRSWSRFPCDGKALYQRVNGPDAGLRPARLLNISVSGMALQVEEPIALGELLSTELHDAKDLPTLTILACVVHVQNVENGRILGCNFIRELSDKDIRSLL